MKNKFYLIFLFFCTFPLMGITCEGGKKISTSSFAPSILSITPNKGPITGGTTVIISGTNFTSGTTTVTFGVNSASNVVTTLIDFSGLTQISCTTPGGAVGTVDVVVTTPNGSTNLTGGFTYPDPPQITSINPTTGSSAGGTKVTIDGKYFEPGATSITIDGGLATNVNLISTTQLTCRIPAGATGSAKDAKVITPWGEDTLLSSFTFLPPPVITSSIGVNASSYVKGMVNFKVTASNPNGSQVNLSLINPPPGCIFSTAKGATSPATRDLRWLVTTQGKHTLIFQANDDVRPHIQGFLTVTINVRGSSAHSGLLIGDVTGDGILDVVGGSRSADGVITNAGTIYVWAGTTIPSGTPTATLRNSLASSGDQLGEMGGTQGIFLVDVTGDGILDIVAGATNASVAGVSSAGAVYLWHGGTGLTGIKNPDAYLILLSAFSNDQLGFMGGSFGNGGGIQFADVNGDGITDVVVGASLTNENGIVDSGGVYIWYGGGGLSGGGNKFPNATLFVPDTVASNQLGLNQGMILTDITGDGIADVIVGASLANANSVTDSGALYIWNGGAGLTSRKSPDGTLTVSGATADDQLGFIGSGSPSGAGILVADVTGDGVLDIIAGASSATVGGVSQVGAIYVWSGASGLSGNKNPTATLTVSGAFSGDRLGATGANTTGIQIADVSGDGILDIIAGASSADLTMSIKDVGAIYVWNGGAGLVGSKSPNGSLFVSSIFRKKLTLGFYGFFLADVTNDGILDVIGAAEGTDISSLLTNVGAVYVWYGGIGLGGSPNAYLEIPSPFKDDQFGTIGGGPGVHVGDVTGDGILDLVIGASSADLSDTTQNTGTLYVWEGASSLSSSPSATLRIPGAVAEDRLGFISGVFGIQLADVTGDGILDIIAGASLADISGVQNTGSVYVWNGGTGLTGGVTPSPSAILTVSGATAEDQLGSGGYSLVIGDVSGDGNLDIIVAASMADIGGNADAGAIYLWNGGSGLAGNLNPNAILTVSTAVPGDQLGGGKTNAGIHLADINQDGILDIVVNAVLADNIATVDTGAIYFWSGGSGLTGNKNQDGTLIVTGATTGDRLGD